MKCFSVAATLAATIAVLAAAPAMAGDDAPHVRTKAGAVAGAREGDIVSFKGIPYAAPPVGDLRWRAPQPVKPWSGVRAADKVGAVCQQKYNAKDNGVGPLPMSEDCLTLNIFAPAGAKRAPVMFWIHGGGFVNGSGTAALYDGSHLARQGVIVVTINYRLGRFGFFAHPALTAEAKGGPVGNYALMDMVAALKWVRANIVRFGGDPRNVTIFGESAGGAAVNDLMISPAARGLFARAIVQSGLGREPMLQLKDAEQKGLTFAASLGAPKDATAADLRRLTAKDILGSGDPDMFGGNTAMIDGAILTSSPVAGFRAGRQADVPYIVGWNSLEFPAPAALLASKFSTEAGGSQALLRIKSAYPDEAAYEQNAVSDVTIVEPGLNLARLHAAQGHPTRVYQFSVLPKGAQAMLKGAPHATDREYVFQTLNVSALPTGPVDATLAKTISAYWTGFARNGNPDGTGRPAWPLFSAGREKIIDFTNDGPQVTDVPRSAALDAIAGSYPKEK